MSKVLKAEGMRKCIGCFTCMIVCAGVNQQNHSVTKSALRIRSIGGLIGGFRATICIACEHERACMEACPTGALQKRPGGGVVFQKELCTGCRRCETACIVGAVNFNESSSQPIICRHCGVCARFCPHECLTMEESGDVL